MKTPSLLSALVASSLVLAAVTTSSASTLIDPMDSVGNWQVGGGSGSDSRTLTINSAIKTEGTGSLELTANYTSSSNGYTDIYQTLAAPLDFSTDTFSLDFWTTNTAVTLWWRFGNTVGGYYGDTSYYHPVAANTWETVNFTVSNFTALPSNLASVNFIQLRVIGDALGTFPQVVSTNFDNMQIVPEPSAVLLALLGGGGLVLLKSRRLRRL